MKKIAIILTIVAATAMIFSACGKYEEGPSFSLLTKKSRITGTWNQTEFYIKDKLQNNSYKEEYTFNSDGTGTKTTALGLAKNTVAIVWEFNEDKTILMVKEINATKYNEYTILRLTNKEMWIANEIAIIGLREFRYKKV